MFSRRYCIKLCSKWQNTKRKYFQKYLDTALSDAGERGSNTYYYHEYVIDPDKNKKDEKLFNDKMNGSYLGPEYSNDEIKCILDKIGATYEYYEEDDLFEYVANLISEANAMVGFRVKWNLDPEH